MNAKSLRRRDFLQMTGATLGATTLGSVLAACGGTTPATSSSPVTVAYWDWWISQAPWVDNEIKLFQQANPKITIKKKTQPSANYGQLLSMAITSHTQPDVAMMTWTPIGETQQFAQGWWLPLNKWATSSWQAQFPPQSFYEGSNMLKGKIYSAPFDPGPNNAFQLYINNSLFKQAGLTNADGSVKLPQTWDDVTNAAAAITKKGGGSAWGLGFGNSGGGILQWWMNAFARGGGALSDWSWPDYRTGKWTFGSERVYEDFCNLLLEWKQKGYLYPNSASSSDEAAKALFAQGKIGMMVGGIWNQGGWTSLNFTDFSMVGIVPPALPLQGYWYAVSGGLWIGITAGTKHPDESWAWLDWLYSKPASKRWVEMGEGLSNWQQYNNPSLVTHSMPGYQAFSQYIASSSLTRTAPNPPLANPQLSNVNMQGVTPNVDQTLMGIYTGQLKDIHGALSTLESKYNKSLTDAIAAAVKQGYKVSINDYIYPDWDPTQNYVTKPRSS